jgi:hypothetical protein
MSAVSGEGMRQLVQRIGRELEKLDGAATEMVDS